MTAIVLCVLQGVCEIYRCVHTNALYCALGQIASNSFELICIHFIHTLYTEREFDYGIHILLCVGMW